MKPMILAALIALITVSSYPRDAMALSGKELLEYCEADDLNPICVNYIMGSIGDTGFCMGCASGNDSWVQTSLDQYGILSTFNPFCLPEGMTMNTSVLYLQNVLIDYLRAHPDDLHLDATELRDTAFIEAFPCS